MKGSLFGVITGLVIIFIGGLIFIAMSPAMTEIRAAALDAMPAENNETAVERINEIYSVWTYTSLVIMFGGIIYIILEAQRREPEQVYYGV